MATRRSTTSGNQPYADDLKEVVAVARGLLEREFSVAERLDAKARGQVMVAGQWFAVAQAVLAVALNNDGVDHRWLLWTGASLAVGGGIALVLTTVLSWQVWRIREDREVTPQALIQMKDYALRPDRGVLEDLITQFASTLQVRRALNAARGVAQKRAEMAWFAAMALPLLEVFCALAAVLVA